MNYPFFLEKNLSLLFCLHMALSACSWTGRFFSLLCLLMTPFTILMKGIFCGNSLSLCFGLMAIFTYLATGLALLPGVVTLQTINLQCLRMFLVCEGHLPEGRIEFHHILCEDAGNHQ